MIMAGPIIYSATVNEPGLFEIRSFDQFGQSVYSYTVFDGQKKAEISLVDARLLAPLLNNVDLKPIVAKALVLNGRIAPKQSVAKWNYACGC